MDSSLPSPTSLEDSSKKEENSFIFDELDFLIQLDGSPPSLFELLPNFLGDESSCLAEQDSRGLKEVVSDQEESLPLPEEPVNQEKPSCRDEAAGKIIQQQCTKDGEKQSETSILDSISTQLIFPQVVFKDSLNVVTRLHDNNNLQALNSWNDDAEFNPSMLLGNSTPMITGDNDSYKRGCACKKIKCLKAYCGCFADGFKCTEFCTCIRCSNRPEYQVAIDNAKQKQKAISRKPVASVSETRNDSATNILPLKNEEEEDVNPYSKIEDLHHNIMHHVSHPTPPKLQDFGMSRLPPKNVTQHLTPLTNPASRDWRHSNGNSLFGDPLITPHTSTTPTTTMTRFGRFTSQRSLESSNLVSFAFNTEQNATSTSPNIMEDSNPKRHKQGWTHITPR